jgi:hypothetical protein
MKLIYIFLLLLGIVFAEHEDLNQVSIQVGTDGDKGWTFSGFSGVDPELTLQRGIAYTFLMNAPSYQLILQEHDKPHITIAQSAGSGTGHFVVVFDNSIQGKIRYKASNAIWMHGDITLTGTYDKPDPVVDNLYPSPSPPASPLPSPGPASEPTCCDAVIASCEACKAKMSVDQYCHYFPSTQGCISSTTTYCCKALIAPCLACELNMELDNYCSINPNVQGCEFGAPSNGVVDDSVGSRIVLDIDFSEIGSSGSHIRNIWQTMLVNEFATVMGISKERITIDRVTEGSVIVDFSVHDGPSSEITPEQAIELLNSMVLNTGSGLWTSNYLNILPAANRIKSWPLPQVNGSPMDPPIIENTVPHAHPDDHNHDAVHNDDDADHHHHPKDGSEDPNDHNHKKDVESSDDETDWVMIGGLGGGTLVVVILLIIVLRDRTTKKIIHKRVDRINYQAPYTLYT